jgi:predicted sugar kinase
VELAVSVGRGKRSAVGTYGFALGGLIVERGKLPGEAISPLDCHLDLPAEWGALLACPRGAAGLANLDEALAFEQLPQVPTAVTKELARIVREEMVPGAAQADFEAFADAVYRYGRLSGTCFAALQGGPYNGPKLTAIVERCRAMGLAGVGQSSWGPTIYALVRSRSEANDQMNTLSREFATGGQDVSLQYGSLNRGGATIDIAVD